MFIALSIRGRLYRRDLIAFFKSRSKSSDENIQEFYEGFREAVHEIKLVKEGKIKARSLKDAINDL